MLQHQQLYSQNPHVFSNYSTHVCQKHVPALQHILFFWCYYRYFYFLSLLKYNFRDKYNRWCTNNAQLKYVTFKQVFNYGRSSERRLDYTGLGFWSCAHCHRPPLSPFRFNRRFVFSEYISGNATRIVLTSARIML